MLSKNIFNVISYHEMHRSSTMTSVVQKLKRYNLDILWRYNLNPNEQVLVDSDVHMNVQTNLEKNVDANGEHLDEILLETIEDISDDEQLTYISIDDKITYDMIKSNH